MITQVSGMFKNETKKFKHNNNLEYFAAYCFLKHFEMHGLDKITYCPYPTDTNQTK